MEKQVKEQIVELSRILKLKKMFSDFILHFEPLKKRGLGIRKSYISSNEFRYYTDKISVVTPKRDTDFFTKLKIICELVREKPIGPHVTFNSIFLPSKITRPKVIDAYLENYFQEHKDKYKVKKTDVYFIAIFGLIYTIIFLGLFIFNISGIFNYGLILIMLLVLWLCIVWAQYILCIKSIF